MLAVRHLGDVAVLVAEDLDRVVRVADGTIVERALDCRWWRRSLRHAATQDERFVPRLSRVTTCCSATRSLCAIDRRTFRLAPALNWVYAESSASIREGPGDAPQTRRANPTGLRARRGLHAARAKIAADLAERFSDRLYVERDG